MLKGSLESNLLVTYGQGSCLNKFLFLTPIAAAGNCITRPRPQHQPSAVESQHLGGWERTLLMPGHCMAEEPVASLAGKEGTVAADIYPNRNQRQKSQHPYPSIERERGGSQATGSQATNHNVGGSSRHQNTPKTKTKKQLTLSKCLAT